MQQLVDEGGSRFKKFAWTDDAVAELKKLWADGMSASAVAARLMVMFGGYLTRSAAIGKLYRLGAAGTAPKYKKRSTQNGVRTQRSLGKRFVDEAAKAAWLQAVAAIQNAPDLIVPLNERKALLDLKDNDCRWPHGDPKEPDFHFCNRKKVAGLPYCDFHAKRAYAPPAYRPRVIPRAMGQEAPIVVVSEFDAMERA